VVTDGLRRALATTNEVIVTIVVTARADDTTPEWDGSLLDLDGLQISCFD
jgi:hypothetical protein